MPRFQTVKYKCLEFLCNKIVRGDKWIIHCKDYHRVKFNRDDEVKRHIVEVKHGDGPWQKTRTLADVHKQKTESSASSTKDEHETSTVTVTQVSQVVTQDIVKLAAELSSVDPLSKMCDPAPGATPAPCKTELSGSSAEDQNESTFVAALDSSCELPSRRTIVRDLLPRLFESTKNEIRSTLDNGQRRSHDAHN